MAISCVCIAFERNCFAQAPKMARNKTQITIKLPSITRFAAVRAH